MENSEQLELFPVLAEHPHTRHSFVAEARYGRLVTIEQVHLKFGAGKAWERCWVCHCDCGIIKAIRVMSLVKNEAVSCGCVRRARFAKTHGMTGHPVYNCWENMRHRCENPNLRHYKEYGGRGIDVCSRWHEFLNFYADMGDRPSEKHSIDRKDNNGGYWCGKAECSDCGPGGRRPNCRWATKREQMLNQRGRARPTHCKRGHVFDETNTLITARGNWLCRACDRMRTRADDRKRGG